MTFRGVGVKVKGHGCTTLMKWTNIFKTVNILYTDIHYSILGTQLMILARHLMTFRNHRIKGHIIVKLSHAYFITLGSYVRDSFTSS
jgi:uncharacterized membrane protein